MTRAGVLVVKLGGSVLAELPVSWWDDLAEVAHDASLVLVHGWSKALGEWSREQGRPAVFLRDRYGNRSRLTTPHVIEDIAQVSTRIRDQIGTQLSTRGVQLDTVVGDRGLLRAGRAERLWWRDRRLVELDNLVGPPEAVDLRCLPSPAATPSPALLVTPLARDPRGRTVNTDADRAAAALAAALRAEVLVLVTDVPHVRLDGTPAHGLDHADLPAAHRAAGDGMRKKLQAAHEALNAGLAAVVIGNGPVSALRTGRRGTVIRR